MSVFNLKIACISDVVWHRTFVLNQFLYISDKVFVDILFIQPLTNRLSYNIFKIYCAWRLGKVLDIYPGLYPLSKTLASCRTFDCIFPNDALSLIKVHCSMQSFDVRFCKEYAVVYLIKIYLLIPKILHLNCKAIILKIIVKIKKKTEKKLL